MIPDYAIEIALDSIRSGDTFEELTGILASSDVGNLTSIELTTDTEYKLTSADGDITITDAATHAFKINKFIMTWPSNVYFMQWRFTFDSAVDDIITAFYTNLEVTK